MPNEDKELLELLDDIANNVATDESLDDEVREQLVDLIKDVMEEPIPENLRVLAITLEQLSDNLAYASFVTSYKGVIEEGESAVE